LNTFRNIFAVFILGIVLISSFAISQSRIGVPSYSSADRASFHLLADDFGSDESLPDLVDVTAWFLPALFTFLVIAGLRATVLLPTMWEISRHGWDFQKCRDP
jgi:hypothetical protein